MEIFLFDNVKIIVEWIDLLRRCRQYVDTLLFIIWLNGLLLDLFVIILPLYTITFIVCFFITGYAQLRLKLMLLDLLDMANLITTIIVVECNLLVWVLTIKLHLVWKDVRNILLITILINRNVGEVPGTSFDELGGILVLVVVAIVVRCIDLNEVLWSLEVGMLQLLASHQLHILLIVLLSRSDG